ncbi:MAG: serine/threonine-protein kinase [Myxococcales bacterium]|nr:serine/threonine-protein kinase [Myxococcales bacterium]
MSHGAEANQDRFGLIGTELEGKFRVERFVAEGGFAAVYQAVHLTLERPVAVKVLKTPPEFNEEARQAFIEKFAFEAKTIARISHPNIVQVLDYGASEMPSGETAPWMVLEWLTGQTLDQDLKLRRESGGRTPEEALNLLRPVFEAMAFAHEEGIAHRDIKPANMMLAQARRGPQLRLLDFGIAKIMGEDESAGSGMTKTMTAMQAFSPKYAAPEQIGGARTGPWTDVHAMGIILTEVITDLPPYNGKDMTTRFAEALSPVRPTPLKRKIDVGAWEPIIAKATALQPTDRFPDCGEFLAALEAALPGARKVLLEDPPPVVVVERSSVDRTSLAGVPTAPLASAPQQESTTLSGSAFATELRPPPESSARRYMPALMAGGGLLIVVGALAIGRSLATPPPPPPPAPAVVARPVEPAEPVAAPPVVAAPAVAAPVPVAAPVLVADAGPPAEVVPADPSPVAADDRPRRRHRRGHGHGTAPTTATPAAPANTPTRPATGHSGPGAYDVE